MEEGKEVIMNNRYKEVKRAVDIVGGLTGTVIVFVVCIILFIPYRIGKNKGKMIFKQKRIGENGELFEIYKFRSMRENADIYLHENRELYDKYVANGYKLEPQEDPRITKLGIFLRKTSLDELPQFINVLQGNMTLVGPRPIVQAELEEYTKLGKKEEFLSMKPGITGIWQVSGRSNIGYPERVYLEISYLEEPSLSKDLVIILKTVLKVFKKEGAY